MSPGSLCDGDQGFCWSAKMCWLLIAWFLTDQTSNCSRVQIFGVRSLIWSARSFSKRALIALFNLDPSRKRFYTGHISDYPLQYNEQKVELGLTVCLEMQPNLRLAHERGIERCAKLGRTYSEGLITHSFKMNTTMYRESGARLQVY